MKILLVEDNPGDARLTEELLKEVRTEQFEIAHAKRLSEAIYLLSLSHIDAILLDLGLPDSSGINTFNKLRDSAPQTPIVVLSGAKDEAVALKTVQLGAQDYLIKGEANSSTLHRVIRYAIERQQVAESLLLIRKAVETASDAIAISDSQGHHIYQNKAFTDLFEYTAEELEAAGGEPAAFVVSSVAREVFESIMSGRSWSREVEMRAKSGRIFSLFLRADAIKDNAGKIVGLIGVFTDITERKRLEYQLRKKHDELQLILDSMPAYVFYKDKDGKMLNVNKSATALAYVSKDKLLQKTVFDLMPAIADKYNRDDMEVMRSGQPKTNIEESLELPSGVRWLKTDKLPIKDDDGNIVGLLSFSVDITDLKKTQEELYEKEALLRSFFNSPGLICGIVEIEGDDIRYISVNAAMAAMYGLKPEAVSNKLAREIGTDGGIVELFIDNYTKSLESNAPAYFEYHREVGQEMRWFYVTATFIGFELDSHKPRYAFVTTDITDLRRAEEDIKLHLKRIEALYGIAQVISQSSTLDTMLKDALDKVCNAMDTESGCIFMLDLDEGALKLRVCKGVSESAVQQFSTIVLTEQGIERVVGLKELVASIDKIQDVADVDMVQKMTAEIGRRSIAAVPFFRGNYLQGLIVTFTTKARTFSAEDLELLKAIANEMSVGVNNITLLERMREMSVTDELTGLYNRRYFFEMLDVEINRATRTNHPFSLVMLDLDGFKEYNDRYGHTNGDAVLQTFSQALKSSIRKSDMAFRYGGDEFALILPVADAERSKKIVQRTRVKWQKVPQQSKIFRGHVGFSTGIVEYPENAESSDGLIFLADAALYQAKKKGYEDKLVSELRTLSTDIIDVATQDQVYALAATVDARDPYTYGHSQRVAEIATMIGKEIGMSAEDLTKLNAAALLHDVGKVGVPDSILTKVGKPTSEEWDVIKKHCAEGARILSYVKELSSIVPIVLHHHEWYDGSGYPSGLKGIDIPSGARITSVADAYDTMVTKRPYRNIISPKEACEELKRCAGVQFDPIIVDVWCRLVGERTKEDK